MIYEEWPDALKIFTREILLNSFSNMYEIGNEFRLKKKIGKELQYGYIENEPFSWIQSESQPVTIHCYSGIRKWNYSSLNELIDDGWVIDHTTQIEKI